jgi:hypothetical protein
VSEDVCVPLIGVSLTEQDEKSDNTEQYVFHDQLVPMVESVVAVYVLFCQRNWVDTAGPWESLVSINHYKSRLVLVPQCIK